MDDEINNIRRLAVFREVPRPITPKWVFRRKFENGTLVKHKVRLVAQCFIQVSGIDYHDAYLYAPVVRLETFRRLLHYSISHFVYSMSQQPIYMATSMRNSTWRHPLVARVTVWRLQKGLYGLK